MFDSGSWLLNRWDFLESKGWEFWMGSKREMETREEVQIPVPGCWNSWMSEELYDAGFCGITNVDFSKVVISDMLRRNVRERPGMRWRFMDMTTLQFEDGTFDVVLDGGFDATVGVLVGYGHDVSATLLLAVRCLISLDAVDYGILLQPVLPLKLA